MTREVLPEIRSVGPSAPTPAVFGIFDVEQVTRSRGTIATPVDRIAWRLIVFERFGTTVAQNTDGSSTVYEAQLDSVAKTIRLTEQIEITSAAAVAKPAKTDDIRIRYSFPDSQHVVFRESVGADSITVLLKRADRARYSLLAHRWQGWGGW